MKARPVDKEPAARRRRKRLRRLLQDYLGVVVVPLTVFLMFVLRQTWRKRVVGFEAGRAKPVIYAIYHGDLLGVAAEMHKHVPGVDVVTSRSRDGGLVERFVRLMRAGAIRGGSSKGGVEALRAVIRGLKEGRAVVVAVDGPRGPEGTVKPGIILAAARTGVRIVPGAIIADREWRMNSWDRMVVPKPFARVALWYGDPISVPRDADREQVEELRLRLAEVMARMHGTRPEDAANRS